MSSFFELKTYKSAGDRQTDGKDLWRNLLKQPNSKLRVNDEQCYSKLGWRMEVSINGMKCKNKETVIAHRLQQV